METGLILTGNELLEGFVRDENTSIVAHFLIMNRRHPPQRVVMAGDRAGDIADSLRYMLEKSPRVIIITGGLGPTEDDITVQAVAKALGRDLVRDEDFETDLEKYRYRIEDFILIPNPSGKAPGMFGHEEDTLIVLLPGVPSELRGFLHETRMGKIILDHLPIADEMYLLIKTGGLIERELRDILSRYYDRIGIPDYIATPSGVIIKLRGKESEVLRKKETIEKILGSYIWGYNDETLEGKIADILKRRGLTIATAESCTSGKLPDLLTSISGSSAYFKGGMVAYETSAKERLLGVPHEVIEKYTVYSHQTAAYMAVNVKNLFGAHIGISTTGMAENPDGSPFAFIGIAFNNVETHYREFIGERNLVRTKIAYYALFRLFQKFTEMR